MRHELRLLFGVLQRIEDLPLATTITVKAQREADPALGFRLINWHRSRPGLDLEKRALFLLSSGSPRFRASYRFRSRVCHHFVTTLVHGVVGAVNRVGIPTSLTR